MKFHFSDWFCNEQNSVWCQINGKSEISIGNCVWFCKIQNRFLCIKFESSWLVFGTFIGRSFEMPKSQIQRIFIENWINWISLNQTNFFLKFHFSRFPLSTRFRKYFSVYKIEVGWMLDHQKGIFIPIQSVFAFQIWFYLTRFRIYFSVWRGHCGAPLVRTKEGWEASPPGYKLIMRII